MSGIARRAGVSSGGLAEEGKILFPELLELGGDTYVDRELADSVDGSLHRRPEDREGLLLLHRPVLILSDADAGKDGVHWLSPLCTICLPHTGKAINGRDQTAD